MSKWLAWKVGKGDHVKLGEDPFIRGKEFYKSSPTIVTY